MKKLNKKINTWVWEPKDLLSSNEYEECFNNLYVECNIDNQNTALVAMSNTLDEVVERFEPLISVPIWDYTVEQMTAFWNMVDKVTPLLQKKQYHVDLEWWTMKGDQNDSAMQVMANDYQARFIAFSYVLEVLEELKERGCTVHIDLPLWFLLSEEEEYAEYFERLVKRQMFQLSGTGQMPNSGLINTSLIDEVTWMGYGQPFIVVNQWYNKILDFPIVKNNVISHLAIEAQELNEFIAPNGQFVSDVDTIHSFEELIKMEA